MLVYVTLQLTSGYEFFAIIESKPAKVNPYYHVGGVIMHLEPKIQKHQPFEVMAVPLYSEH